MLIVLGNSFLKPRDTKKDELVFNKQLVCFVELVLVALGWSRQTLSRQVTERIF